MGNRQTIQLTALLKVTGEILSLEVGQNHPVTIQAKDSYKAIKESNYKDLDIVTSCLSELAMLMQGKQFASANIYVASALKRILKYD